MENKFKLTKKRFIDWYFSDSDDIKTLGNTALEDLKQFGEVKITI